MSMIIGVVLRRRGGMLAPFRFGDRTVSSRARELAASLKVNPEVCLDFSKKTEEKKAFSDALWILNASKRYDTVSAAFDHLPPGHKLVTSSAVFAAMLAYSEECQPGRTRELIKALPDDPKLSSISCGLLMHAYCSADRISSAERLLNAWLELYISQNPEDTHALHLLRQLRSTRSIISENPDPVQQSTFDEATERMLAAAGLNTLISTDYKSSMSDIMHENMYKHPIPMSVWVSLLSLYSMRGAWQQCMHVLEYLEESATPLRSYSYYIPKQLGTEKPRSFDSRKDKSLFLFPPDQLLKPSYLAIYSRKTSDRQYTRSLLWSTAYHLCIRALCGGGQYKAALDLADRMREHSLQPQLPAAIPLMKGLYASSLAPDYVLNDETFPRHKEIVLNLQRDVLAVIISLTSPAADEAGIPYNDDVERSARSSQSNERRQEQGDGQRQGQGDTKPIGQRSGGERSGATLAVNTLAREYLELLCKFDFLDEALQMFRQLQQHSSAVSSSQIGRTRVEAVLNMQQLAPPLAQYLRERGEWEAAADLFSALSKSPVGAKQPRKVGAAGGQVGGSESDAEGSSRSTLGAGKMMPMVYHNVCDALRRAGKWEELTAVMDAYSTTAAARASSPQQ